MKTIANNQRTAVRRCSAILLSAVALTSVMLLFASCTGNGNMNPAETATGTHNGTGTTAPLDPNAGTVNPNGDAGNPPAGTDDGQESRQFRSDFMH